jgi:hypothetical protein
MTEVDVTVTGILAEGSLGLLRNVLICPIGNSYWHHWF